MPLWDQLKQRSQDMSTSLKAKSGQLKNKTFSEAAMAMCALVAAADGTVDPAERRKVAGFVAANDVLSIFPTQELQARFDYYCTKLSADFDFGKIEAIQVLGKLKKKTDLARAVIQVGIIVGGADGHFDDAEKEVVREVCHAVGMNPAEFDL